MCLYSEGAASTGAGEKDDAELGIENQGGLLHIRYFALRDATDRCRGVLETVQDATAIRALQGNRRLLDWWTVSESRANRVARAGRHRTPGIGALTGPATQ